MIAFSEMLLTPLTLRYPQMRILERHTSFLPTLRELLNTINLTMVSESMTLIITKNLRKISKNRRGSEVPQTTEVNVRPAPTEVEMPPKNQSHKKPLHQSMRSHPSYLKSAMSKMMTLGLFNKLREAMKSLNKKLLPKMRSKALIKSMTMLEFICLCFSMVSKETRLT